MQWHKRDSCTHSFWHQVIYTYCTSLLPPPSNILYRARYKTGLEFENIMQGSAGVWIFNVVQLAGTVCNAFTPSSLFCYNPSKIFLFSSPSISPAFASSLSPFIVFSAFLFIFAHILPRFFFFFFCSSMLLFVVPLPHRVLSLSFFRWLKGQRRNHIRVQFEVKGHSSGWGSISVQKIAAFTPKIML